MTPDNTKQTPKGTANISFIILIAGAAALGGFLFGFDTAIVNGAVQAIQSEFQASALLIGFAISGALLGSAFGAFFAGGFADKYGRIPVMLVAAVLFAVSAIGSAFPFGIYDFIAWRMLGGFGVGLASVIAPAYIAECSPAALRGRLGSMQQLAIVTGIFIALLCSFLIARAAGSAENPWLFGVTAWRWMLLSEVPPALLYGLAALYIPESPRFLIAQGRDGEAVKILSKIEGSDMTERVEGIRASMAMDHKPRFSDVLSRRNGLLPIVWIGIGLAALQQFVGINVIFYYSSVLWRSVGFSEGDSLLITVITGVINILTTLIAIAYVDKFGRKPLLIAGSIGMTITLGTLALIFGKAPLDAAGNPNLTGTEGIIALLAANLFVFAYGFSWGPVVWVMLGEMFNNKIRGVALSVSAAVQWIANFLISTTFPPLLAVFGLGVAYGLYTIAAAISFFFVILLVKETKGKTLEQM
ncbi:MAG: D-xylose-proton symporter [Chroococcopsis gigantea SAG 12.99]|jgi:SP family sugar:H+ symporter-like MFS transporter|nr:sugar porter family MFS transporter [Chlorogloea purpurea SAG 13.99]MDV2998575.1 D-xylose-proton symporter [Chroococcopsis gigantea SAG 12.99]